MYLWPFWFEKSAENKLVFGLPGNPVSTYVCYHIYFRNWLKVIQGIKQQKIYARLAKNIKFKPDKTYIVPVNLIPTPQGGYDAYPLEGSGSGDLANLSKSNGLLILPRRKQQFRDGEVFEVILTCKKMNRFIFSESTNYNKSHTIKSPNC